LKDLKELNVGQPDFLKELAGLFLTLIPIAWAGLRMLDWLQNRWKR
jgi:hypothetical protein